MTTSNTIIGYGTVNPIISIEVPANLGGGICGVKKGERFLILAMDLTLVLLKKLEDFVL